MDGWIDRERERRRAHSTPKGLESRGLRHLGAPPSLGRRPPLVRLKQSAPKSLMGSMACDCAFIEGEGAAAAAEEEEEVRFFDARDDLSCPGTPVSHHHQREPSSSHAGSCGVLEFDCRIWIDNHCSIQERRRRFRDDMKLSSMCSSKASSFDLNEPTENSDVPVDDGSVSSNGGVASTGTLKDLPSTSGRFSSLRRGNFFKEEILENRDPDVGRGLSGAGSNCVARPEESPRSNGSLRSSNLSSSSSIPSFMGVDPGRSHVLYRQDRTPSRRKFSWLRRLGTVACTVNRQEEVDDSMVVAASDESVGRRANRVKVHRCGKQSKEFSALYMGQDVKAHDGAICAMRFSHDGQYLASGGEDGMVRVWQVMECDFDGERDLPRGDPSCICFTANHSFDLDPMHKNKEKRSKPAVMSRASDAACVIIPPKVFRILEEPLHEFRGHRGKVLDLSWSKNKFLLSSSEDKSVRLWQVGCSECIKLFPHNDFVTCVHFSPIDANFFVSGSLDCKVRIWDVSDCHVISWADIKEIVTAVCYQPDGKGIVAGSMGGICCFYHISDDNHLQLIERICLLSKKKYPSNRIAGFQFSPIGDGKLMVTSADSQIKILDGSVVVGKYKGLRNATSQISASFTADGRHIISASEDSNVHIWNHTKQHLPFKPNRLRITQTREYFFSREVSVALPWQPPGSKERLSMASDVFSSQREASRDLRSNPEPPTCCQLNVSGRTSCRFALNQRFFTELLPRGSATWPEEKLPSISATASPILSKLDYKFLKACCEKALASHAWGQVIVTAGLDGRIRSYCNYGLPVGS